MQQVEWNIPASVWAGLNTKYDPLTKMVGPDDFIQGSINYDLSPTGNIIKRTKTNLYNPTPLDHPIKDEFEMIFSSGSRLKFAMSNGKLYTTDGSGVFTQIATGYVAAGNMEFAAQDDRVYFGNGIDNPQVVDMGSSYGGVSYTPPTVARAGVIPPSTNLTAASPSTGGSIPDGAHTYKYTFLYYDEEESNGSAVSATQTCGGGNNTIALSSIDVGGVGVTARKIYRDNNDGNWQLVHTIPNNTATTYTDTAALGTTPIPEDNNLPPIWGLVTQFRDRLWVAGIADAQSTLRYSDAGLPDVWPTNNFIACNQTDSISAITSFNDKVTVFGKHSFGIILGSTSDDFRYIDISPNIGCTDNRSLQTVTINGVPKLQWLSQFGMYQWDGANLQLISDKIENLLRFNIQQSQGAFNRNIQSSAEDFLAGTSTPGVNLVTDPGEITVRGYMKAGDLTTLTDNPTKSWDTQAEWQGGTSDANLVTSDGSDSATTVLDFLPTLGDMTLSGLALTGHGAGIAAVANVTGENHLSNQAPNRNSEPTQNNVRVAQPIVFPRGGVITTFTMNIGGGVIGGITNRVAIYSDSGGVPGGLLFNTSFVSGSDSITATPNLTVTSGQRVWFAAEQNRSGGTQFTQINGRTNVSFTLANGGVPLRSLDGGGWVGCPADSFHGGGTITANCLSFAFTQTAVAQSGTMSSPSYDTLSTLAASPVIAFVVDNPTGGQISVLVTAADDAAFSTGVVTHSNALTFPAINTNFGYTVTLTNKRYWKYVVTLSVADDRNAISTTQGSLAFPNLIWISEVIDHTTDIISLDALTVIASIPSGSALSVTIATSTDNSSYSSFTAIGSAVARRYSKIRAIFTKSSGNVSPSLTAIQLDWSLTSTLVSYAVNTVITPVQWGIFQDDANANGGTLVFQTRSATTEGGLSVASWTTVTNGVIIPSAINQWVQWRVTFTSHANMVPVINSVILSWLNVTNTGIRVASLFYNQTYYIAAAEINSLTNNIVLYYDREGRWGQYTDLTINTMGLFFGQAYYGDALLGNYFQWLNPTITNTDSVEVDIRSKAYSTELISNDKTKALRHLIVECDDSQATITPFYSVDEGNTWLPMVDVVTGFNNFFGAGTTKHRKVRFVPTASTIHWGYSIIVRLYNNDHYPLNIVGMRCKAYVSERPVLLRG